MVKCRMKNEHLQKLTRGEERRRGGGREGGGYDLFAGWIGGIGCDVLVCLITFTINGYINQPVATSTN